MLSGDAIGAPVPLITCLNHPLEKKFFPCDHPCVAFTTRYCPAGTAGAYVRMISGTDSSAVSDAELNGVGVVMRGGMVRTASPFSCLLRLTSMNAWNPVRL